MNQGDKDFLDEKLDNIFIKMGLEFSKFSSSVDLRMKDLDAGMDITHLKLDESIRHQKETNGRVTTIEDKAVLIPKKQRLRAVGIVLAAVFLVALVSSYSYHHVNWKKTLENKTNIELNETT